MVKNCLCCLTTRIGYENIQIALLVSFRQFGSLVVLLRGVDTHIWRCRLTAFTINPKHIQTGDDDDLSDELFALYCVRLLNFMVCYLWYVWLLKEFFTLRLHPGNFKQRVVWNSCDWHIIR